VVLGDGLLLLAAEVRGVRSPVRGTGPAIPGPAGGDDRPEPALAVLRVHGPAGQGAGQGGGGAQTDAGGAGQDARPGVRRPATHAQARVLGEVAERGVQTAPGGDRRRLVTRTPAARPRSQLPAT